VQKNHRRVDVRGSVLLFCAVLLLLGTLVYLLLMEGYLTLRPDLARDSNDIRLYHAAANAVLRGEIPYRDFFIEYPPASSLVFIPPALLASDRTSYALFFASEMSLSLVAALFLVGLAARKTGRAWPACAVVFALGTVLLFPVATVRYDPAVALSLAAAAACAAYGRYLAAYALLGFGAAAKLVPALATFSLAALGRDRLRRAAAGYAVFFATLALFFAPALTLGERGLAASFGYQAGRGLQLESLASSVLLKLGWVRSVGFEYGAFEVHGRGTGLAASLSFPLTAALLLISAAVMWRRHARDGMARVLFPRYAAAFILAFMLGSKVLSPQYMIWLLPLVPLAGGGPSGAVISAVFVAACWLTTQVYPLHYDELRMGLEPAVNLLLGRNLLLVLLWILLLLAPAGTEKRGA
jgi:hypothetical protein